MFNSNSSSIALSPISPKKVFERNLISYFVRSTLIPEADFGEVKLATGGIVERPTRALIGEAGPEAVVPLNSDKSMNVFSKSLEDKLDRLIAAVEKGGVVMLDGQKVGEALVVNSYRVQ